MRDIKVEATEARMFVFDSVAQMTTYADETLYEKQKAAFVGMELETFKDVEARSSTAWGDGLMVLEEFVKRLRAVEIPDLKSRKRRTTFQMADGDEIDLEKMQAGEAFWRKTSREQQAGSNEVTVVIDTSTPFHMASADILWRGAAAIALTQILEEKGYQVEVIVVNGSRLFAEDAYPVVTAVRLKAPSDPLDTSTLVNAVAGWFYRTATFTLMYTLCKRHGKTPQWGLGSCYSCKEADLDLLTPDDQRIYSCGIFTFNGAADLMIGELQRLAVDPNKAEDADAA